MIDNISLEEARRIVAEAEDAANPRWPAGSHLVSTFTGMGEGEIRLNTAHKFAHKAHWRELTPSELDLLRGIPELARALK